MEELAKLLEKEEVVAKLLELLNKPEQADTETKQVAKKDGNGVRKMPRNTFTKPCHFYKITNPDNCKRSDCTFLHLNPTSEFGAVNVNEEIFLERRDIILKELKLMYPGSKLNLRSQDVFPKDEIKEPEEKPTLAEILKKPLEPEI